MSLAEVMRTLGLDHATSILDAAPQKAIDRAEAPTALLDHLYTPLTSLTLHPRALLRPPGRPM
jgi:hypothetical protein